MIPETLKRLAAESNHPPGIAARVESTDLKQLLEEHATFLYTLERVKQKLLPGYTDLDAAHALVARALFVARKP